MGARRGVDYDLLVAGPVSADVVFSGLDRWPENGRDTNASGLVVSAGGFVNCAVAARRLGLATGLVSVIGSDLFTAQIRRECASEDVTLELCAVTARPLVVTVILNYGDDRGFVTYWGDTEANQRDTVAAGIAAMDAYRVRHLHVLADGAGLPLARAARDRGLTVSTDVWEDEAILAAPATFELAALADVFFANAAEARLMTGAACDAEALRRLGELTRLPVVKRGHDGAAAILSGATLLAPVESVEPVDSTGAGDCFAAGFLYGWLRELPVADCLALGNTCGRANVLAAGGYQGSPTEADLLTRPETPASLQTKRRLEG